MAKGTAQQPDNTTTFEYDGSTVTIIRKRKNRHRDTFARVLEVVRGAGIAERPSSHFAAIVAYTTAVEGDLWQPPPPDAAPETILAAYDVWWNDVDGDATDAWLVAIYPPPTNLVTSPVPLAENAPPN